MFSTDIEHAGRVTDAETFQGLYNHREEGQKCGDASVFYLYSEAARKTISRINPNAKILIMLRPPFALMNSMHLVQVAQKYESISEFSDAVTASTSRRPGDGATRRAMIPMALCYDHIGHFGKPVQLWVDTFGANVKVVFTEDLENAPVEVIQDIYKFIGVDSLFTPKVQRYNGSNTMGIRKFLRRYPLLYARLNAWIPTKMHHKLANLLLKLIPHFSTKRSEPDDIRAEWISDFESDIEIIEKITGRNLDSWG